jgi:hypothetical protein
MSSTKPLPSSSMRLPAISAVFFQMFAARSGCEIIVPASSSAMTMSGSPMHTLQPSVMRVSAPAVPGSELTVWPVFRSAHWSGNFASFGVTPCERTTKSREAY